MILIYMISSSGAPHISGLTEDREGCAVRAEVVVEEPDRRRRQHLPRPFATESFAGGVLHVSFTPITRTLLKVR
jgi:hypothetical protein